MKHRKAGADGLELDLHYASDGQLVVFHDFELERLTGAKGMVFQHTAEALARLGVNGTDQGIPTLEAVLRCVRDHEVRQNREIWLNVELKAGSDHYPGIESAAAALCLSYLPSERLIFSSFDHFALLNLKALAPSLQTGVLTTAAMVSPWRYVADLAADYYHPNCLTLTPKALSAYEEAQLKVNTYTVNDSELAKRLFDAKVHGIISDRPEEMIRLREASQ